MNNGAVKLYSSPLYYVPDYLKTQKVCNNVVQRDPFSLHFVSDWFLKQQDINLWNDDNNYCNDSELIEWYNKYKKWKAQKAKIKKELFLIAWHPDHVIDWCMPEDGRGGGDSCF